MIKKILLVSSVACLATVTAINTQFVLEPNQPFSLSQTEALASGETLPDVDVVCSKQSWGRCYEIVYSNLLPHCKWSGYQDDYCPWEN